MQPDTSQLYLYIRVIDYETTRYTSFYFISISCEAT